MNSPPSLRTLAKHLNLAPATVSAALNDKRHVAAATRRRVLQAARELGYERSSAMSAAMSAAGSRGGKVYRETVACVGYQQPLNTLEPSAPDYHHGIQYARGIEEQAKELGCDLDFLAFSGHTARSLSRILEARGISRVIFVLGVRQVWRVEFFEEIAARFSTVFLGYPETHRCPGALVCADLYQAGRRAFIEGWKAGYRRYLLLGLPRALNPDGRFEAGFMSAAHQGLTGSGASITRLEQRSSPVVNVVAQDEAKEPTCMVGGENPAHYPSLFEFLKNHPLYAWIDWHANLHRDFPLSGIDQGDRRQGQVALELCLKSAPSSSASREDRRSEVHLIEPVWCPGETLRQRQNHHLNLVEERPFPEAADREFRPLDLSKARFTGAASGPLWQPEYLPPGIPSGRWAFQGVEFMIPPGLPHFPPAPVFLAWNHKTAAKGCGRELSLPVGRRATDIYLLHGCGEFPDGGSLATLTLELENNRSCDASIIAGNVHLSREENVRRGADLLDWWPHNPHFHAERTRLVRLMEMRTASRQQGCYYVLRCANPHPEQAIRAIKIRLTEGCPGVYFLFAMTLANRIQK